MFKKRSVILFLVWCIFCVLDLDRAKAQDWVLSVNGEFGDILCVYGIDNTDEIYIGTDNGLYQTRDTGAVWSKVDVLNKSSQVRDISAAGSKLYTAGDNGIYERQDNGQWFLLSDRKDFKGLSFFQKEKGNVLLAWSCNKLFKIEKKEYSIINLPGAESVTVNDVICRQDDIFLLLGNGLFYSSSKGSMWQKVLDVQKFDAINKDEETEDEDIDDPALQEETFFMRSDIAPFGDRGIIVLVSEGVFILDDNARVSKKIKTLGLKKEGLKYIVYSEGNIFAASDKRVYYYIEEEERWQAFFEKSFEQGISCLKVHKDKRGDKLLWVSAGKYLYCRGINSGFAKKVSFMDARLTGKEMPISEVHKMAVEYAEVSPEKIREWRRGAGWKAVMPKLSVGFSESLDDNTEIYTSATTSYAVTGPRERNDDWGIDLTWDLADIIWNDAQTSIDTRSRLMVQLRDEILEEVTRLYFERKRLIKELDEMKQGDNEMPSGKIYEKEIRIEELTAHIDAFTGGKFSKALNK